jgi:spore germination cell wall hydrolase CwlJ-like protein
MLYIRKDVSLILALVLIVSTYFAVKPLFDEKYDPMLTVTKEKVAYKPVDFYCLAKNIYHEAGYESDLGKYAVAQVTINRLQDERWPKTICEVVMEPYQFSWTNNPNARWFKPNNQAWVRSKEIAYEVLEKGVRIRTLENAYFFHADYVKPVWRSNRDRIAQIDRHIFYAAAR